MVFGRISQIGRNFVTSAARRSGGHDHGGIPGGVSITMISISCNNKLLKPKWRIVRIEWVCEFIMKSLLGIHY
jgi:hypothetical protein